MFRLPPNFLSVVKRSERIITDSNRPNLTFEIFSAPDVAAKLQLVREFLSGVDEAAAHGGIIYTGTRRDAEEVAEFVREVIGVEAQRVAHLIEEFRGRLFHGPCPFFDRRLIQVYTPRVLTLFGFA